jgi:hypothetical protein
LSSKLFGCMLLLERLYLFSKFFLVHCVESRRGTTVRLIVNYQFSMHEIFASFRLRACQPVSLLAFKPVSLFTYLRHRRPNLRLSLCVS